MASTKAFMGKRSKRKHKFGRMKVCEIEKVREYFTNPKIENKILG